MGKRNRRQHPGVTERGHIQESTPTTERPKTSSQKWAEFIDSPWTVGIVLFGVGAIGMLIAPILLLLVGVFCVEFYRKGVVQGKPFWWQLGAYTVLVAATGIPSWLAHRWVIEDVIPRAYLYVEDEWMQRNGANIVVGLNGRTGGEEIPLGTMRVAIVADTWGNPSDISDVLKRANWQNGGTWIGGEEFNHSVVRPGKKFSIQTRYIPNSLDELNDVLATPPKKFLIVLTVACYKDKWGARPNERSCAAFSSDDNFQRPHVCIDEGNPKQTFWSFLFPSGCKQL